MFRLLIILPALWIPISLLAQGVLFSTDNQSVRARLVHDVAVLTSDSLKGREAGTEGEAKAARYLSGQFKAIGLTPVGDSTDSYYQQFSKYNLIYNWATRLDVNGRRYIYREEFGITALSMNGSGQGALIDGKQGLVIPERQIDQLSGLGDLKGKFVLINLHVPNDLLNDTSLAGKLSPRHRMISALNSGAQGVIFWNTDSPWFRELFDFQATDTLPGLSLYVNLTTADRLLKQSGFLVDVNVQISRNKHVYTNVIGFIDNHATRTIIIGAHYDHLGTNKEGRIFYGADDNASGTAGMVELARYFATHRDTLNNYMFIGFTAEEKGLYGSGHFVKHPAIPLSTVRFMLNLDMIGRLGCEGNTVEVEAAGSSPVWRKILRETPHYSFNVKCVNGSLPYSDHYPFYQDSIPVLFLNTGIHDDYHTITDKASTLNYDGMVEIIHYIKAIISQTNQVDSIPYRSVPMISQASASVGFFFQALSWLFIIKD